MPYKGLNNKMTLLASMEVPKRTRNKKNEQPHVKEYIKRNNNGGIINSLVIT